MIILYILLIITAVFLLLILAPARCILVINSDGGEITLKYLFLRIKLYPSEKKKSNTEKEEKKEEKTKNKKNADIKNLIKTANSIKSNLFKTLSKLLRYISRHAVTIEELNISSRFGTGDPANTGMLYGAANAALYGIIGKLKSTMKLKKHNITLEPDFDNTVFSAGLYMRLRTRIVHMFYLLCILLNLVIKYRSAARRLNK